MAPFEINNSRNQALSEILALRADRETETNTCLENLLSARSNVFLYGERGVGKTFLVRLIEEELKEKGNNVFPFTVNASEILWYDRFDPVSSFPAAILIHLCDAIWRNVLRRDPDELVAPLFDPKYHVKLKNREEELIQQINTRIRLQQRKFISQRRNTVGLSAVAKAEMDETYTEERTPIALLPFEFFQFVETIQRRIFQPRRIDKMIVLCDEINILPVIKQRELIERYIEMFTDRSLQFLFVAGFIPNFGMLAIPDCFDVIVELTTFHKLEDIQELIDKRLQGSDYTMCKGASDELLKSVGGNPRFILMTCEIARQLAMSRSEAEITLSDIKAAATKFNKQRNDRTKMLETQMRDHPNSPVPEVR